jgi:hypothetical protein
MSNGTVRARQLDLWVDEDDEKGGKKDGDSKGDVAECSQRVFANELTRQMYPPPAADRIAVALLESSIWI